VGIWEREGGERTFGIDDDLGVYCGGWRLGERLDV
jgi:hypothetical protein